MTPYEDLRAQTAKLISSSGVTTARSLKRADEVLGHIRSALEKCTPAMVDAFALHPLEPDPISRCWRAMLKVSAIGLPKKEEK